MASSALLSDLCEQIVDCPHSTPEWTDSGVVVLRSQNIKNGRLDLSDPSYTDEIHFEARTRRAVPSAGDLVITREAPMGEVCMIPRGVKCCLGQRMVLLRPDQGKADSRFLLYVLQSSSVRHEIFVNEGTGSTVSNLRIPLLEALPIPTPPLPEQRAIAHILGTLDDKIELNRKMNETLEAMARALFKSWFVDFDPVRAKAEGRDPGLPAPIAALFPDSFEDSELGEIPTGWMVKQIGDLATVQGGSTPSTKEPSYWEGGTHYWVTPKDLSGLSNTVLLGSERKITDAGLTQISSGLLPEGTVLLSSRAPIGYLAVAEVPVAINQGFIAMQPLEGVSNLFLLLWAEVAHEAILSRANGSTFLEISKSSFRPIPVVAPTRAVMEAFDRAVRPMYSRIVVNERESRTLSESRHSLLPKLISGEVRVLGSSK
jgi:type I restriction enzyme S subunit